MVWALLGIVIGILVGIGVDFPIPLTWTRYTAVIVVGMLDALFGALRAEVSGGDRFDSWIFISGFLFNVVLALGITFLGDKLGLDLYLAATFVFTFRIFNNLGQVRREVLMKFFRKKQ